MSFCKISKITITSLFLLFSGIGVSDAFEDDGFGSARKIEGKHFTIYCAPQLDLAELAQQLNIGVSDKFLAGKSTEKEFSSEAEVADMLDTIFVRACDILDMQLYSFHGTIKICRDAKHLNSIYNNFFAKDLKTRSFYVYSLNTVYTSADNFTRGIIGHEIAHAIISHYFVVQPSVKIQEVLVGYVEYQLCKTAK